MFLKNYKKNSTKPLVFANFGVTDACLDIMRANCHAIMDMTNTEEKGWFKKPVSMIKCPAHKTVWLDTDCEVVSDISSIFDYYKEDKIGMVHDRPWSKRRPDNGPWYNSGVVLTGRNWNLRNWVLACEKKPVESDQQVLHYSMTEIEKIGVIEPLPHKFNSLRLDSVDGIEVKNPLIIHHTGSKGNDKIRKM